MQEPYPLTVERRLSPRLWGGSRLGEFLGIDLAASSEPIGEAWQVFEENRVANGPDRGIPLAELARAQGEALLGSAAVARYGRRFPLLAKFIDAAQKLSIQVHPDDAYAREREAESGFLGKTEAWYILDCPPGATVTWGFRRDVAPAEVRAAIADGRLEELLQEVPVAPGDVILNPAGTVHAVGAGILLFEIQQSSDLTYRLYDYDRVDAAGRPRELHVERALEVAELRAGGGPKPRARPLGEGRLLLAECEHFLMEALRPRGAGALALATSDTSVELLTVVEGEARLAWAGGAMFLARGTSVVLPAALGAYRLEGSGETLRCYLPGAGGG